jgi:hypothetical protein
MDAVCSGLGVFMGCYSIDERLFRTKLNKGAPKGQLEYIGGV